MGSGEEDLRCRNTVVLVAERLEGEPVNSRVSTFPDVFSMAKGGPKCAEGGGKPWV